MWEQNNRTIVSNLCKEVKVRRIINEALRTADFSKIKLIDKRPDKLVIEISNLCGETPIINVNGSRINK